MTELKELLALNYGKGLDAVSLSDLTLPITQKRGYLLNFFRKYPLSNANSIKFGSSHSLNKCKSLFLTIYFLGQKLVKDPKTNALCNDF